MAIGEGTASTNQGRHDYVDRGVEAGFFTDPTVCIGCKACEVACKEWNLVPEDGLEWSGNSYDNTGALGASTWRHVMFVEQDRSLGLQIAGPMGRRERGPPPGGGGGPVPGGRRGPRDRGPGNGPGEPPEGAVGGGFRGDDMAAALGHDAFEDPFRWIFLSDVCKHCEVAGCLEACPTGSIVRTENGAVYVQDDICNGCGYCVVGCPFGVIDQRPEPLPGAGGAFKCTFCYDRQASGLVPACAKACPTESIRFGPLEDLRREAAARVGELSERGYEDVRLYDPRETSVGGIHAFFLLLGEPEAYGLPPRPEVPTVHLRAAWTSAALTALSAVAAVLAVLLAWP